MSDNNKQDPLLFSLDEFNNNENDNNVSSKENNSNQEIVLFPLEEFDVNKSKNKNLTTTSKKVGKSNLVNTFFKNTNTGNKNTTLTSYGNASATNQPMGVGSTTQKKTSKSISPNVIWIVILFLFFYYKKDIFFHKFENWFAKHNPIGPNMTDFENFKKGKPIYYAEHPNLDPTHWFKKTNSIYNTYIGELILLENTGEVKRRYILPKGVKEEMYYSQNKNKITKAKGYVREIDYFIDDLINSNNDLKQKALLQEWNGGPTFYVPLSKLEYYDEVAIRFMYNEFDSYIKKDTGIVYLPSFFYDLIMKGSNVRNLKLEDIPTKKLSNLFNSENTENDILEKANNYYNSGKYKSAQKLYSKYLEKNPDSVNIRLLRAYTFLKTKSYNNAKNDYNKYIDFYESNIQESEMPSELITAYLYRGITLYQLEQYEDALIDFHKVLDSNASNSFAYLYRGLCQRQLSISDLGCSDFQKSFDLGNNEAEIYLCNSEEFAK